MKKRLHENNVHTRTTHTRKNVYTNNVYRVIVRTKKGLQDAKKGLQGVDLQGVKEKVRRVHDLQGVWKKRSTGCKICRVLKKKVCRV